MWLFLSQSFGCLSRFFPSWFWFYVIVFNIKFRCFSPTLIEEEEEWIDAKDFKHILDLRHKILLFLLKNSIRSFAVKDATFSYQRCSLSLSKSTIFPFSRRGLSHQMCFLWMSKMGLPPVHATFPCPRCYLSLPKMVPFPIKDEPFPIKNWAFPCQRGVFPCQR